MYINTKGQYEDVTVRVFNNDKLAERAYKIVDDLGHRREELGSMLFPPGFHMVHIYVNGETEAEVWDKVIDLNAKLMGK